MILALAFALRKKVFLEELFRLVENRDSRLFAAFLALILGLVTVILHNVWIADWRVIITLFGWSSLIKGALGIVFPEFVQKFVPIFKNKPTLIRISLVVMGLLGVWLIWLSS